MTRQLLRIDQLRFLIGVAALLGLGSMRQGMLLLAASGILRAVGLSACVVPLIRVLRIDPTEALRAEA